MSALLAAWILVVTLPETGEIQYYQFESKAACEEVVPALTMFYEDFEQDASIECKQGELVKL